MPLVRNRVIAPVESWIVTSVCESEKTESGVVTMPVTVTVVPTGYGLFWMPLEVMTCRSPIGTANAVAAKANRTAGIVKRGARRIGILRLGDGPGVRKGPACLDARGSETTLQGRDLKCGGVPRQGKRKPGDRQRG